MTREQNFKRTQTRERNAGFLNACYYVQEVGLENARYLYEQKEKAMRTYDPSPFIVAYWEGFANAVVWFV